MAPQHPRAGLQIATDGSYSPITGNASWAWIATDGSYNTGTVSDRYPRSPLAAELEALHDALTHHRRGQQVTIHVDSKDALRLLRGTAVAPKPLRKLVWTLRSTLSERSEVHLAYVKGHSGHRLNTAADALCVASRQASDAMSADGYAHLRQTVAEAVHSVCAA